MQLEDDIENLLRELEISRILVCERNQDSLDAAQAYFATLHDRGIFVNFSTAPPEAMLRIRENFTEGTPYGMVISAYHLEIPHSGLDVMAESIRYGTPGFLLDERKRISDREIFQTQFVAAGREPEIISLPKSHPTAWQIATCAALYYMNTEDFISSMRTEVKMEGGLLVKKDGVSRNLFKSMMRHATLPLQPDDNSVRCAISQYERAIRPESCKTVTLHGECWERDNRKKDRYQNNAN